MTSTMPFLTVSPSSSPLLFAQNDDQDLDFEDGLEDFDDSRHKPPRRRWFVVILTILLVAGLWYVVTNPEIRSSLTQVVTGIVHTALDLRAEDPASQHDRNVPGPSNIPSMPAFHEGQLVAVVLQGDPLDPFRLSNDAEGEQRGPLVKTGDVLTIIDGSLIKKKWVYFVQTTFGDSGWIKEAYLQAQS